MTIADLADLIAGRRVVDLTHSLEEGMPAWPQHSRFFHGLWDSHETGSDALTHQLVMNEHTGTHMDAPAHFLPVGHSEHRYIDQIEIWRLHAAAHTLDVAEIEVDDVVQADRILRWEAHNGRLNPGRIVLFRFGWDRWWAPRSVSRAYLERNPGLSVEAAHLLVDRGVAAVGSDTGSPDSYLAPDAPVHRALLGAGVPIVENLTNLDQIVGDSYVILAPLPIKFGSGSPLRAFAITEQLPIQG